jgi:hypothetical protein
MDGLKMVAGNGLLDMSIADRHWAYGGGELWRWRGARGFGLF